MIRAIQNIIHATGALMFCWIVPLFAIYDAITKRGTFVECQKKEWKRWWDVYLDLRA